MVDSHLDYRFPEVRRAEFRKEVCVEELCVGLEHLEHLGAGADLRGHNVAKLAVLKIG